MKALTAVLFALVPGFCLPLAAELATERPWLEEVVKADELVGIHTVQAIADVEVSDGDRFSTTVVYHDPQRAVFQTRKGDQSLTMGIDGRYAWSFDGSAEAEADSMAREMVLGHQFHAQILFFDRFHPDHEEPRETTLEDRPCSVVTGGEEGAPPLETVRYM